MEVWYGPDQLCTLDLGSSRHLSWADSVLLITRMVVDEELHITRMLANSAMDIARMLTSGAWVSSLNQYYGDGDIVSSLVLVMRLNQNDTQVWKCG